MKYTRTESGECPLLSPIVVRKELAVRCGWSAEELEDMMKQVVLPLFVFSDSARSLKLLFPLPFSRLAISIECCRVRCEWP